ncbi:uncharacterized protein LOC101897598 isoform X2 [Musca domestica]|uniref:Uncharacterized protein LOC101897598 isoform X2 n=1 Tax=Musca domestica TaxID=7370 RepID=A0A9J7IAE0_MUSDO|nr:uncharacterized protein LOC101897598 isoform X2 [Musca domestica]
MILLGRPYLGVSNISDDNRIFCQNWQLVYVNNDHCPGKLKLYIGCGIMTEENNINKAHEIRISPEDEKYYTACAQYIMERNEEHFFAVTRMTVDNYNLLFSILEDKLERFSNRRPIGSETRLAVTVIFLANDCNVQVLALVYNIGISTVRKVISETCDDIWNGLHPVFMLPPNKREFKIIAKEFYANTSLPNCLGVLGAKDIRIASSHNSKTTISVILLIICDANYVFTHVHVCALSNDIEGGILAQSEFGQKILDDSLDIPCNEKLPGSRTIFPYYFVADRTFPLRENVMRPFPGNNLTQGKEIFNSMLSNAQEIIENAFGILSNRWKILHTKANISPEMAEKYILATVALHNFLMIKNDNNYFTSELIDHQIGDRKILGKWREEHSFLPTYTSTSTFRSSSEAFLLREELKEYFLNNLN